MDDEELIVDPLFKGLTRPSMKWGVPFEYIFGEVLILFLVAIWTDRIWILLLIIPVHLFGFLMCQYEPRAIEHVLLWIKTTGQCLSRKRWGGSSYDPLAPIPKQRREDAK